MKKAISMLLAFVLLFSFCACGTDTSKWTSNDVFASVPVYKYADVTSTDFGTSMNVKIEKTTYEDFLKYIDDLKKEGFEYLEVGSAPENYSLNSGTAQWRCTDGKVYLQLIFSEDGAASREMFGCNLQIYGYSDKSYLVPESKKETKNKNNQSKTASAQSNEKND